MRKRAMNWFVWIKKFQPIQNKIDKNAPVDGFMFETYGKEYKAIEKQTKKDPKTVWTLIDGTNRKSYIIPGWHWVNRLGYFITKVPCHDKNLSILV